MDGFMVRQLSGADWEIYRNIRLESLKNEPAYFSPSRDETAFTEGDWRERLGNGYAATFGLFAGEEIIGSSGIMRENNDAGAERAFLVGMYIRKEYRRRGLSAKLFKVRMDWAKEQKGIKKLVLEHREDNLAVQKAHQKLGFRLVSSRKKMWPDGMEAKCLVYEVEVWGDGRI